MSWVSHYGLPGVAYSDNGNAFVSNLFQDILKTFNIEVRFSPAYFAANNGAIERKHQDLKNSLRASLIDMGNKERDKWMTALPWVLLGKRIQFQPHLDTSSAQLVLGMSPRIPGQLLGHPGPPLNTAQLKALLNQLYKLADRPGIPTSGKREILDIENTQNATHVYVKVDNPQSLCPKFEGPYEIYSRPSRSQVEVKIGLFRDGRPRLLTFNWNSCKLAHLRDGAEIASRPNLGRKPKSASSELQSTTEVTDESGVQNGGDDSIANRGLEAAKPALTANNAENKQTALPAKIQTNIARPVRQTRNKNPTYVFT